MRYSCYNPYSTCAIAVKEQKPYGSYNHQEVSCAISESELSHITFCYYYAISQPHLSHISYSSAQTWLYLRCSPLANGQIPRPLAMVLNPYQSQPLIHVFRCQLQFIILPKLFAASLLNLFSDITTLTCTIDMIFFFLSKCAFISVY